MKTLTRKDAKLLAKKYLTNDGIDPLHFIHTKKIVSIVKIINKGKNIDKNILEACAWIHDIGYSIGNLKNRDPRHLKNSIKILNNEGYNVTNIIKDCVMNHDGKGNPKTKEGKLLQIAIKLNIIDKDFLKFLIKEQSKEKGFNVLKNRLEKAIKMFDVLSKINL